MSSDVAGHAAGVAPILWRVIGGGNPVEEQRISHAQELERKFQEGLETGLAEGVAAARRESEAQLRTALERLGRAVEEIADVRRRVREETTADLVRLSVAIAERILHREVTIDPDAVQGLVKAAFDKVEARESVRVFVHPSHEGPLRRLVERQGSAARVEIVADPALNCGDVRLDTVHGQLDASIQTQLREVERGLADRLEK